MFGSPDLRVGQLFSARKPQKSPVSENVLCCIISALSVINSRCPTHCEECEDKLAETITFSTWLRVILTTHKTLCQYSSVSVMAPDTGLPLTSLQAVLLTTGLFLLVWTYLKSYIDKNGRFGWAETLLEFHNFLTDSLSLALAAYVLDIGHDVLTASTGYQVDPHFLGYAYHLLKIYEYFDIILAILCGDTKISKYTAFSHLALPFWSFFRIFKQPNNSTQWRLQVIADCFVRFLSRAIPWLVEDVKTEEALLAYADEGRWYADLAISGIWAFFTFQGQRESEQAVKVFGKPYEDEATAYLLSAIIMLYAAYARREVEDEDAGGSAAKQQMQQPQTGVKENESTKATSRSIETNARQSSRRRGR